MTACRLAATMGSPGGPTQKKHYGEPGRAHPKKNKKIFLVVVAHDLFKHVQIQPILLTDKIRKFFMQLVGASH